MKQKKVRHGEFSLLRTHHTIRVFAKLVGLNKSTVQDIKTKIDKYGSPLPHKQTGHPLKINERIERHLKRTIREDPFAFYKEINMELAKLDTFVCIETFRSYVDRLDFKSYRTAHKPRLTAKQRKSSLCWAKERINWTEDRGRNAVWSDEWRFCMKGSKRGKGVLRKESERYYKRNIVSTVKWSGSGIMVWRCFWGRGFGPLEIIDTGSVGQETYINILANMLHSYRIYINNFLNVV
jgi:transposase